MIQEYSFGKIVVGGEAYHSDIIIYPDGRVQGSWWREEGHRLSEKDIIELINAKPEMIIAGTGASGLMVPEKGLEQTLSEKGIEFTAGPTERACALYNEMHDKKRTGACFHLTC